MKTITSQLRPALLLFAALSLLTGLLYPAAMTGLSRVLFPAQAGGSLIEKDGRVVGSALVGQPFADPARFWGRPSATSPFPDNAAASAGSNLGPTNPALLKAVKERVDALRASDPGNAAPIPPDLVTASGSGLDPHISPAAAYWQVPRVARALKAKGVTEESLKRLVAEHTEGRDLGLLGEPRVNVLKLNLALDALR
jgi:K+-transporting ATPase ATPase C chain